MIGIDKSYSFATETQREESLQLINSAKNLVDFSIVLEKLDELYADKVINSYVQEHFEKIEYTREEVIELAHTLIPSDKIQQQQLIEKLTKIKNCLSR